MRSHLLTGKVRHRRATPVTYELEHDVFYAALDLGELDAVAARSRLIRRNRRGLVVFRDADHLPTPAVDLDADIRTLLAAEGDDPTGWRITLITNLRFLGYVFNPASFFLCRDAAGVLRRVIVEVHNTFGERHLYPLRPVDRPADHAAGRTESATAAPFRAGMPKAFFVSPFISIDGSYAVHVRDDAEGVQIAIALRQADEMVLSTSLVLARRPLTDRNLVRLLLRHPFMTQRTIALIHWHAFRLWLRGAPFFRHGAARRAAGAHHAPGQTR